jgi:S1-C subfamily serine protease
MVKNKMSQLSNPLEVLKSISEATSMLIKKISQSVVSVKSQMSHGTGVVLTKDGYIVTCNHVLAGCNTVKIGQGEKTFNAKIVGTDPYNDLALLKAEIGEFTPIEMGDSEKLSVGQYVLALANPFNRNQPTATTGIVTNVNSTLRGWRGTQMENVIATDAQLNPGFSGGPLVDVEGRIIGINAAYVWQRGIAIPINKVKAVADDTLRKDEVYAAITAGGRRHEVHIAHASGTADNPMSDAAIEAKFMANAVPVIGRERAERARDFVWSLETQPDVRALIALLA